VRRIGIAAALLALSAFGFAQEVPQPGPLPPTNVLGPQLIVWSQQQEPQPIALPQRLPPPQRADQPQPEQTTSSQTPQPSLQVFTGTVVKEGNKYVLTAEDATYQLDDQGKAKFYEGKQVKVAGSLGAGNMVHITSIDLLS
jgi:hypothetical protein